MGLLVDLLRQSMIDVAPYLAILALWASVDCWARGRHWDLSLCAFFLTSVVALVVDFVGRLGGA